MHLVSLVSVSISLLAATTAAAATTAVKQWTHLKALGKVKRISINNDKSIWGVNMNDQIVYCADYLNCVSTKPRIVKGSLSQISSNNNGVACGVNRNNEGYCRKSINDNWVKVGDYRYKNISISEDGTLWAININNKIFSCNDWNNADNSKKWNEAGRPLYSLRGISSKLNLACGVDTVGVIQCTSRHGSLLNGYEWSGYWSDVKYGLQMKDVSTVSVNNSDNVLNDDNESLWAISKNNEIFHCSNWYDCRGGGKWIKHPSNGVFSQISAALGVVCVVNDKGNTWCKTY